MRKKLKKKLKQLKDSCEQETRSNESTTKNNGFNKHLIFDLN